MFIYSYLSSMSIWPLYGALAGIIALIVFLLWYWSKQDKNKID